MLGHPSQAKCRFVACMEDVLDVYQQPYDSGCPVICMDEKPYQLLGETREALPMKRGRPKRWRQVNPQEHRTKVDWAHQIRRFLEIDYPDCPKIRLIMDNLNTHSISSLYEAFPPEIARSLAKRLEIHYTPKHGS